MRIVLHLSVSSMLPPQFDLHDDKTLENLEHPLEVIKRDKNLQKISRLLAVANQKMDT